MNRIFMTLVLGMLCSYCAVGQSQVENILNDAKRYNEAYLDEDKAAIVSMTIPSIVDMAGGKEVMEQVVAEHFATMKQAGVKTLSITPMKPSKIMFGGNDLHSILPQRVITAILGAEYVRTAYFLVSSSDDGKSWTFVDLEPYDDTSIKIFVPSFSGDLKIPANENPVKLEKHKK